MVTISPRTRRRSRPALWKIRLALYGLSALALLFSVCLVFTDLLQEQYDHGVRTNKMFPVDHQVVAMHRYEEEEQTGTPGGVVVVDTASSEAAGVVVVEETERKLPTTKNEAKETEYSSAVIGESKKPESVLVETESSVKREEVIADPGVPIAAAEDIGVVVLQESAKEETPSINNSETEKTQKVEPDTIVKTTIEQIDEKTLSLPATDAPIVEEHPPILVSVSDKTPAKVEAPVQPHADNTLFVLVADSRSASDWIMSRLDLHPNVCASSETGGLNNGVGYPQGCMLPDGMPWLQDSDPRQGCILAFIRPKVKELIEQSKQLGDGKLPQRCQDENDPLAVHMTRLCQFARTILENDEYDTSSEEAIHVSITHAYMKAFQQDGQDLLACKCPETTKVRGIKVLTDWIPNIHGFLDRHEGVKVLRLHRQNTFARYMSYQTAIATNIWQTGNAEEKHRQMEALPSDWKIDVDDMLRSISEMERASAEADMWADEHAHDAGRDVYSFEYENCRDYPEECFVNIFSYLGIEDSHLFLESNKNNFMSTFKDSLAANPENLLDKMANQELVREVLSGSDLGHFIGAEKTYRPIQHVQFHIDPLTSKRVNHHHPFLIGGVNRTSVYYEGEGLKFQPVVDIMKTLPPDDIAALSIHDISSVVVLNPTLRSNSQAYRARSVFRRIVGNHAKNHKVVISTTDICCTAALSHIQPTSLLTIDPETSRVARKAQACDSASSDCLWTSDDNAMPWKNAFESMAARSQKSAGDSQIFLDGSLIAGAVSDILDIIEQLMIKGDEDERAVFSDFLMQDKEDRLMLDYDNVLVQRQPVDTQNNKVQGCFEGDAEMSITPLLHADTKQTLFIRTERELGCKSHGTNKPHQVYPAWESAGIDIKPIVRHVDDLMLHDKSLAGISRHFGKEIFYAVTENGIFASNGTREQYRTIPTEEFLDRAFGVLKRKLGSGTWPDLEKVVSAGGFPYFAWYGDYRDCNYHNKGEDSVPLFTTSASKGCGHAFPTSTYMTIIDGKSKANEWFNYFQRFDHDYPWDKKIRKIFWRGTLSESDPTKVKDSIRWRVAKFVADRPTEMYDIFDVGFSQIPDYITAMAGVDVSEAGGLKSEVRPMLAFQKYLAILDMDGNSWSSRFSNLLCYNSVILKVEPSYVDDFYYHLVPWRQYIPVKASLEDLEEKAKFVLDPANEPIVKEIVFNANQWCSEHLLQDRLANDQIELWEKYVKLLNTFDTNWQSSWIEKKDAILKEGSEYDMIALG